MKNEPTGYMTTDVVALWFEISYAASFNITIFQSQPFVCMLQVSCWGSSRSSYDYRSGEGGMEIKTKEMTAVLLRQTGMCNKNIPLSC